MTMDKIKCTHCETIGTRKEFDQHPDGIGWWCPDCQAFIWAVPTDNRQQSTLVLEKNSTCTEGYHQTNLYKFNKRISPLRYPGGKSKLIDFLYTKLQPNKLDTFVEVFAGGASFGLALLDAGVINHLVLNDADKNLITFWQEVLYNPETLVNKLQTINPTHADYETAKQTLKTNLSANPSELAWAYLLVNRLSYSGIIKGGCLGGKQGSVAALLARYNPDALIKQIKHIAMFKDRITLTNQDYIQCIEAYYWDSTEHPVSLFIVICIPYMLSSLGASLCKKET